MKKILIAIVLCAFLLVIAGVNYSYAAQKKPATSQQTATANLEHQLNPEINTGEWTNRSLSAKEKEEILAAHNKYRAELKLPFLTWDEGLAKSAQNWAYRVRNAHALTHSPRGGENLWAGTKGEFTYTAMVDGWGIEKQYYAGGVFPEVAKQSRGWFTVGHYTQIIWRSTQKVGCGIATNTTRDYLVCHYDPVGNVVGQTVAMNQSDYLQ